MRKQYVGKINYMFYDKNQNNDFLKCVLSSFLPIKGREDTIIKKALFTLVLLTEKNLKGQKHIHIIPLILH